MTHLETPPEHIRSIMEFTVERVERTMSMRVCAWCPDLKLANAWAAAHGVRVSHGICPECAAKMAEEAQKITGENT